MKRSEFLKVMGLTAVGAAFAPSILANGKQTNNVSRIATDIKDLKANVNRPVTFLVLGAGNRGSVYAGYAKKYPDCMKIVGVADKNQFRLKSMAEDHDVPEENRFTDWKEALNKTKFADAVIISLPDNLHYDPCMKALSMEYHILLEKPIAPTEKECTDIRDLAIKKNAIVGVCHVLRYAPYFIALKQIIDSGDIGQLISIQHLEPIQYAHMAHSYVRGNWHNSKETTPIILAKSCHDLDIIRWLVGSPCKSISAYGSLTYFKRKNMPQGATERCLDCPHENECPYSALDIYLKKRKHIYAFDLPKERSLQNEAIRKVIRTTDYGRCVFQMDNDQCDHYVTSMEFENGVTANFSMEAFMAKGGRRTQIMGTKGEIVGDMTTFTVTDFRSGKQRIWDAKVEEVKSYVGHGHGGGDLCLVRDFINAVGNDNRDYLSSPISVSVESHIMGFKAEESRLNDRKVKI